MRNIGVFWTFTQVSEGLLAVFLMFLLLSTSFKTGLKPPKPLIPGIQALKGGDSFERSFLLILTTFLIKQQKQALNPGVRCLLLVMSPLPGFFLVEIMTRTPVRKTSKSAKVTTFGMYIRDTSAVYIELRYISGIRSTY